MGLEQQETQQAPALRDFRACAEGKGKDFEQAVLRQPATWRELGDGEGDPLTSGLLSLSQAPLKGSALRILLLSFFVVTT